VQTRLHDDRGRLPASHERGVISPRALDHLAARDLSNIRSTFIHMVATRFRQARSDCGGAVRSFFTGSAMDRSGCFSILVAVDIDFSYGVAVVHRTGDAEHLGSRAPSRNALWRKIRRVASKPSKRGPGCNMNLPRVGEAGIPDPCAWRPTSTSDGHSPTLRKAPASWEQGGKVKTGTLRQISASTTRPSSSGGRM